MNQCKPPDIDIDSWEPEFQAFAEDCLGDDPDPSKEAKRSLFSTEAETTVRYLLTGRRCVQCVKPHIAHFPIPDTLQQSAILTR